MEIIYKKLKELKPYKNNPRKNDEAVGYVAESIKQFGFKVPIIIDRNNEIVAGHTRYKASKKLGIEEVPCIIADDLDEEQIKAFRLADNNVSEYAEWDFDLLNEELSEIFEIEMGDFGFDLNEAEEQQREVTEDEYEPTTHEAPKAKLGDIYQLGNHRLMCGDSTSHDDCSKLTNGQLMDLCITDPPYNIDYTGKTKSALKIQNDKMESDKFLNFLTSCFDNMSHCLKSGGYFMFGTPQKSISILKRL